MAVWIPLLSVTAFWLAVGIGGPAIIPEGPNKNLLKLFTRLTAACCYLFWLVVFLHQINPLIGPQMPARTIFWLSEKWGNSPN